MKVAVSIPDSVFAEAEALAARMKTSRSNLYALALDEFVGKHAPKTLTDAINEALDGIDQNDPIVTAAARRVFAKVEW
jgi:metal-responsive CopG/Arc/MetJ family transcriptional regulator